MACLRLASSALTSRGMTCTKVSTSPSLRRRCSVNSTDSSISTRRSPRSIRPIKPMCCPNISPRRFSDDWPLKRTRIADSPSPTDCYLAVDETQPLVEDPTRQLHAVRRPPPRDISAGSTTRPKTPLNEAALLTNAHGEPSLASELKAEIDSADSIDLLCAFVMWRGLRLLEGPLTQATRGRGAPPGRHDDVHRRHRARGTRPSRPRLRRRGQGPVRRARTRLHAKAWLSDAQHRLRHGVRRLVQPLHERAARRRRVERAPVPSQATPAAAAEVRGDLRLLLERAPSSSPTTRTATATGSTTR